MFYCIVVLQVEESELGSILIDAPTRVGCVEKIAEFVRNVLGGRNGEGHWSKASGMSCCLIQAIRDGYTVFGIGTPGNDLADDYFQSGQNTQIGRIHRYWSDGGDDEFDCRFYAGETSWLVIDELDVRYDGSLFIESECRPDFVACADQIENAAIPV